MVFGGRPDLDPSLTAVSRFQNQSAGAHGEHVLSIEHVQTVKRIYQTRRLVFPTEAAIGGVENYAVGSDGPSMEFVAGETNRADRVALRQRVLPFPTTTGGLRADHSAN